MIKRILPYFSYLKPVRLQFIIGILFGILYSISSGLGLPLMAETVFPVLFGNSENCPNWLLNIADNYFGGDLSGSFLIFCCLAMPVVILLRSIGAIGNGYFMAYVGIHVVQAMQTDMFKKVQALPLSFLNSYKTGELSAAVFGHPQKIKNIVVGTSNEIIKEPLTLIAAISFLIYKSFTSESFFMAIIGFATVPFIILIIKRVGAYLAHRTQQLVQIGEKLTSWAIECFQSPIEIRAYNLESQQINEFKAQLKKAFKLTMKSTRFSLIMSPSIEIVSGTGMALALFLGVKTGMAEGEFLALIVALYMAYSPIKKIGGISNSIRVLEAPLDRLEAVLHAEETISSPINAKPIPKPFTGKISFKGVYFSYGEKKPALNNVRLDLQPGNSYGLIGKTGSGKSTFVNMILRLYDPTKGKILFDGIDIKNFDLQELRQTIAYVPQTPILYNCSIKDNIHLGNPSSTELEIHNAAKNAHIHDFIISLPDGYDTLIGERGNSLSGGQKQKLSIARAFLKDAPILILDEATSSLDNESDKEIKKALENLSTDRTTIVISHRLSTINNIENRILFQNGDIAAFGTHNELISNSGEYKNFIKSGDLLNN
jgi:subfamily B ATP-binding cassette protein MsbA